MFGKVPNAFHLLIIRTNNYCLLPSGIISKFWVKHKPNYKLGMRVTPNKGQRLWANRVRLIDMATAWHTILGDSQCISTCVIVATCMEMCSCLQEMWWALKRPRGTLGARHDESFMPHDDVNPDTSPLWRGTPGLQLSKSSESAARSRLPSDDEPPPKMVQIFHLVKKMKLTREKFLLQKQYTQMY